MEDETMKTKTDFTKTVYTLKFDEKGFPFIETDTLEHRVEMSAEETTSPRGVMSKFFQEGKQLKYWMPNGRARVVDEFETEEEASQEWLERIYASDYQTCEGFQDDYETIDECISWAAEIMEINKEVVKSIMHHHDIYREGESRRRAKKLMDDFYKAKENAKGQITKALRRAMDNASTKGYMWGRYDSWSGNRHLCIENYYTPEFRAELNAMRKVEQHQRRMKFLCTEFREMGAMVMVNDKPKFIIGDDPLINIIIDSIEANGEQMVLNDEYKQAVEQFGLTEAECWYVIRTDGHIFAFLKPEGTRKYRGY